MAKRVGTKAGTPERAVKGCLTRLALIFNGYGKQRFTGEQVAEIILGHWMAFEHANKNQLAGETDFGQGPVINLPVPEFTDEKVEHGEG